MRHTIFIAILVLLGSSACKKSSCAGAVEARVKDLSDLDGCGLVLQIEDNSYIEPTNLLEFSTTFENGDKVWVSYHNSTVGGSSCSAGDLVEIDCIELR